MSQFQQQRQRKPQKFIYLGGCVAKLLIPGPRYGRGASELSGAPAFASPRGWIGGLTATALL